jgi:DNA-binding SARP family transcriptional activator/tetratricopeptide (TPR) repeat protein
VNGRNGGRGLLVARAQVEDLLEAVLASRCTVVCAGPGFGKSSLIETWSESVPVAVVPAGPSDRALGGLYRHLVDAIRLRIPAWAHGRTPDISSGPDVGGGDYQRAESFAAALVGSLSRHLSRPLMLVIDDIDTLARCESSALLDALVRQAPPHLPIVLVGRTQPPIRLARLRTREEVLDIGPEDLAFTVDQVAELAVRLGGNPEVAASVHALTGGWPVATRLALETMGDLASKASSDPPPVGAQLVTYLAEELFGGESADERQLLTALSRLGAIDVQLLEDLGFGGASSRLSDFAARGMYVERRDARVSVIPLVAQVLIDSDTSTDTERRAMHARAARWYLERRSPVEALAQANLSTDDALIRTVLVGHGRTLVASGGAREVIAAVQGLGRVDGQLARLHGEALQASGDWDGALEVYLQAVDADGPIDAGIAWRVGLIHYMRGELDRATEAFQRGGPGTLIDQAMLLGWWAAAAWVTGDAEGCRKLAEDALRVALEADDDGALAAAYTAQAMLAAMEGDRRSNEALYLRALDHAERAGDVLQQIRIHVNRGSRLLEEGAFEAAIAECDVALNLADLSGYMALRALSTSNRGHARLGLGRIDEAAADFENSYAIWEQLGSRQVAYGLSARGDVARIRGNHVVARAAYEEAREVLMPVGDQQGLVPATAGLARVLVDDDPDRALELATSAVEAASVLGHVDALLALSEVHLARSEVEQAAHAALRALEVSRTRRDRAGMAEAIEAACLAGAAPPADLSEAVRIWAELGDPLGRARARLRMVQLDATTVDLLPAVVDTLRELGARRLLAEANRLCRPQEGSTQQVRLQTLGGFRVLVHGEPIPAAAWQSKKARDLLKVLVGRRGRAIHREELVEVLWPDEPPSRTSNRLSVALSVVRSVLDPDRSAGPDHHVEADRQTARLVLNHVAVDLEEFHAELAQGRAAERRGDDDLARVRFRRAESLYVGDLFEEDPYEDWAVAEREQARQEYLDACRWLAADAARRGEQDEASRFLFRVLQRDPYDEAAHLDLVRGMGAARRHGEARRLYGQYCARMAEIGVEAAPYPS